MRLTLKLRREPSEAPRGPGCFWGVLLGCGRGSESCGADPRDLRWSRARVAASWIRWIPPRHEAGVERRVDQPRVPVGGGAVPRRRAEPRAAAADRGESGRAARARALETARVGRRIRVQDIVVRLRRDGQGRRAAARPCRGGPGALLAEGLVDARTHADEGSARRDHVDGARARAARSARRARARDGARRCVFSGRARTISRRFHCCDALSAHGEAAARRARRGAGPPWRRRGGGDHLGALMSRLVARLRRSRG